MDPGLLLHPVLALCAAPLLPGIINRVKALYAGRKGQPLLQLYRDLGKLLRKGAVYSRTTTWVFRVGPIVGLASMLTAVLLVPLGGVPSAFAFTGDLVLVAYLLGLARFVTASAALDTGSSFEGMGASREVQFAALVEPAVLLGLVALAYRAGSLSLTPIVARLSAEVWMQTGPALALLAAALLIVLLTENARIPVDDPNTHLELTMIHEVMVLDHGGPDLAYILYAAALKLWLFAALLTGIAVPVRSGNLWIDAGASLAGILGVAVLVGVIESCMARLRLVRIPQLLVGAGVLSALALFLMLR
jgi:formate hydrogenlyase subunit 4